MTTAAARSTAVASIGRALSQVGRFPSPVRPLHIILVGLALAAALEAALLVVDVERQRGGTQRAPFPPASAVVPPVDEALPEPAAGPEEGVAEAGSTVLPEEAEAWSTADGSWHSTPRELELLGRLVERRESLDERERVLELREAVLDDAEAQLAARAAELEALKRSIEAIVEDHDEKEDAKLASLVKIYETMKPKAAAEIFDRLQMDVLIEVVARMRESKSSDVIGRMEPERARQLTAALAARRKLPVTMPAEREAAD